MKIDEITEALEKSKTAIAQIEPFLKRSESWNLTQKIVGAVACFAGAAFLLGGLAQPRITVAVILALTAVSLLSIKRRVIEAEGFVVKSRDGKKRAALLAEGNNSILVLYADGEKIGTMLFVSPEGDTIHAIYDRDGRTPRVCLSAKPDSAGLDVFLPGSQAGILLKILGEEPPALVLKGRTNETTLLQARPTDAAPALAIVGADLQVKWRTPDGNM